MGERSTLQRELLHTRSWASTEQLSSAIFEWIKGWYNPRRRHTSVGMLSPAQLEALDGLGQPEAATRPVTKGDALASAAKPKPAVSGSGEADPFQVAFHRRVKVVAE